MIPGLNLKIRPWYVKEFPTDELGRSLHGTFEGALHRIMARQSIYTYIGISDSVVRERIFEKLSELLSVSYNSIYYLWLRGDVSHELKEKL